MKEERGYILEFTEQFIEDVEVHRRAGKKSILSKINTLIDEIPSHPTTGIGKPEALRGDRKGQWSRRITLLLLLIPSLSALGCSCSFAWNDSFSRTTKNAEFVALVKVISFDSYLEDEISGHEGKMPYSMTVEIIKKYKGNENRDKIRIYGDNGILCRPYLSEFEIGAYYLIAPIQLKDSPDRAYEFFVCRTDYLKVDSAKNKAFGNYSLIRHGIALSTFEKKLTRGDWDLAILGSIIVLLIIILLIARRNKKMKYILFFFFLMSFQAFATEQIPDKLIFKGEKYYWTGLSPAFMIFRDKGFEAPPETVSSTGLYRKFIMTYVIENDTLYLSDVEILAKSNKVDSIPISAGKYATYPRTEIKSVFHNYFPGEKMIPMNIYNQILIIPYGEHFSYVTNGWSSIASTNYLIFEIENGRVNKQIDLTFEELTAYKKRQFKKFRRSTMYKQVKKDLKNDLEDFNSFRPNAAKYTMDEYLQEIILGLITELK